MELKPPSEILKNMDYLGRTYKNDYEEDIYAAYLVTRYDFNDRFGFKFGARTELVETLAKLEKEVIQEMDTSNVLTQLFDNGINESPFDKNYFKIYPSAFYSINLLIEKQFNLDIQKKSIDQQGEQ